MSSAPITMVIILVTKTATTIIITTAAPLTPMNTDTATTTIIITTAAPNSTDHIQTIPSKATPIIITTPV